jgi:hypothetical protein
MSGISSSKEVDALPFGIRTSGLPSSRMTR